MPRDATTSPPWLIRRRACSRISTPTTSNTRFSRPRPRESTDSSSNGVSWTTRTTNCSGPCSPWPRNTASRSASTGATAGSITTGSPACTPKSTPARPRPSITPAAINIWWITCCRARRPRPSADVRFSTSSVRAPSPRNTPMPHRRSACPKACRSPPYCAAGPSGARSKRTVTFPFAGAPRSSRGRSWG